MSTRGRGPSRQSDRKRSPVATIELKATEVASESGRPPNAEPAEPTLTEGTVAPDLVPRETEPAAEASIQAESPPPVQPSSSPPPGGQLRGSGFSWLPPDPEPEPPPVQPTPPPPPEQAPLARPAIAWLPFDFSWSQSWPQLWPLAAAAVGGVGVTLIVLAATGVFSSPESGPSPLEQRLMGLEQQVRELAAKPSAPAADPKAVEDLAGRLQRLETVAATPRQPVTDPALANRIATLEGDLKALGERIGVLARRNDEIASVADGARKQADIAAAALAALRKAQPAPASVVQRADIDALSGRIAALEKTAKAVEAQLGSRAAAGGDDRALRAAVIASALSAAVDRGAPYARELDAARAVAANPAVLAPLDRFAKTGVPSVDALARELVALMPALAKAAGTPAREGIFERLKANAEKIVRVRPIDEVAGDDPTAVLQRIETRAAHGNLSGALAEIAKLPPAVRTLAQEWAAKVEARNAALEASRGYGAAALAAITKPAL